MARNLNVVAITGNLTRDPELRSLPSGRSVCSLRVAVNSSEKRDGEWREVPNYFDVVVWGAQGENATKYLSKGRAVAVQGRLRWHAWTTQEGGKRQSVEIVAEQVQFLSDGGGGEGGGSRSSSSGASVSSGQGDFADVPATGDSDDIPFKARFPTWPELKWHRRH
jgi:single-strand DNA-binding protein